MGVKSGVRHRGAGGWGQQHRTYNRVISSSGGSGHFTRLQEARRSRVSEQGEVERLLERDRVAWIPSPRVDGNTLNSVHPATNPRAKTDHLSPTIGCTRLEVDLLPRILILISKKFSKTLLLSLP